MNYDGEDKHHTTIGSHCRTGSDNMFVAPVTVGDGAYTAAGSVITKDVPPGSLAVARGQQRNIEGWVARKRPGQRGGEGGRGGRPAGREERGLTGNGTCRARRTVIGAHPQLTSGRSHVQLRRRSLDTS